MDTLEVSGNTRISDLIKWNKESIDAIAGLSKPLEKLRNPILRKLMASRVTITEAAKMGSCTLDDFDRVLRPLGFVMRFVEEKNEVQKKNPSWLEGLPESAIHVFDVRHILEGGDDPLKDILKKFKSVPENEALCIVNKFIPVPLIRLLEKDGVQTFTQSVGSEEYHTYFYKSAAEVDLSQEPATVGSTEKVKMVSGSDFKEIHAKFSDVKEIDVRALQMPGPMETILGILPELADNELLYVNHKRVPLYLLEEIAESDYQIYILNRGEGDVKLLIHRI